MPIKIPRMCHVCLVKEFEFRAYIVPTYFLASPVVTVHENTTLSSDVSAWSSDLRKASISTVAYSTRHFRSLLCQLCHRVDSVIESSLREITGKKKFALINLSLNFC